MRKLFCLSLLTISSVAHAADVDSLTSEKILANGEILRIDDSAGVYDILVRHKGQIYECYVRHVSGDDYTERRLKIFCTDSIMKLTKRGLNREAREKRQKNETEQSGKDWFDQLPEAPDFE